MGLSNLDPHKKKTVFVVGGAVLLYLYLSFGPLGMNPTRIIFDLINAIIYVMSFQFDKVSPNLLGLVLDALLCLGGLTFWIAFFAQFVLPAHTMKERMSIPSLLFNSIGVQNGPAIFIKNGKVIERGDETERAGAGMILLDSASAALLQKKGQSQRPVGPGLVFTERNETIANTIDLRTQVRVIGPLDDDVIFFDDEKGDPLENNPRAQAEREARRMQTSGLTRDGIEVVPNIITVFRLDAEKGEGNTEFGYNKESVRKAILHEAVATGSSGENPQIVPWDWLPAHLAADLWREYLRKITLNQLFDILEHTGEKISDRDASDLDKTDYDRIVAMINRRLTQPEVQALDDTGRTIKGESIESHEYNLLKKHGIQVLSVKVDNLRLRDEEKLIERWEATWLQQAYIQSDNIEIQHQLTKQKAEATALMDFSTQLVAPLYQQIRNGKKPQPSPADTLYELLRGTRTAIVRDLSINQVLADERTRIDEIIEWIKNYQNGL